MKEENYIVVQGFMRTKLNLKGSELLAYALIYGFTQDGETWFTGSMSYIAEWLGIDRRNAIDVIKRLIAKGLIIKQEKTVNGVKLVDYKVDENIIPSDKTSQGGSDETSHHKTIPFDNSKKETVSKDTEKKVGSDKVMEKVKQNMIIDELLNNHTSNEQLKESIQTFIEYRKKKRAPMSEIAIKMMLNKLKGFTEQEQIEAIETSIISNWAGVFPRALEVKNTSQTKTEGHKIAHRAEDYDMTFVDEKGVFDIDAYLNSKRGKA